MWIRMMSVIEFNDMKTTAIHIEMDISSNYNTPTSARQIVKERIEDGANEKAALNSSTTAFSFASISIFPG